MPIAFLICTEPGRLEKQSLLLAESIRKFCGDLKDTPIYSFHPRAGEPIHSKTISSFESLGVIHQQIILNTDYSAYPYANKPLVCAYAEENIDADILVFLDSDKCFFNEPKEFLLPPNYDIGLRPEYGKSIGSTGQRDIYEDYWLKLYEVFNVKREVFVHTAISNTKIRGYWKSGMVVAKRSAGIFTAWKNNFEQLMKLDITPSYAAYFVDQIILSITVCSMATNLFTLPSSYSYPLPLHNRLSKTQKIKKIDNIVSIHYFNLFFYNNWQKKLNKLKNLDKNSDKYKWLCEKISEYDMPYKKLSHYYLVKIMKLERKLQKFKIDIGLTYWAKKLLNED